MCINTAGQGGSPGQPSSLGCRPAERLLGLHGAGLLEFDLLIIDELGYLPMNRQGIHNLFQFIKGLYEYRSVILSQQGLHQLGDLFRDETSPCPSSTASSITPTSSCS